MAFRPPKQQPTFADLKNILANSKTHLDQATYQTIAQIIDRLGQFQTVTLDEIKQTAAGITNIETILNVTANKQATYITEKDESLDLPHSRKEIAGPGITFNDSIPNQRVISSTGGFGAGYWTPLTDGDLFNAELIFAAGEAIAVWVPTP